MRRIGDAALGMAAVAAMQALYDSPQETWRREWTPPRQERKPSGKDRSKAKAARKQNRQRRRAAKGAE